MQVFRNVSGSASTQDYGSEGRQLTAIVSTSVFIAIDKGSQQPGRWPGAD